MKPENSPFPCFWWGIGLEIVGLESSRPDLSTYGRYDFAKLPPLPFRLQGKLDWLEAVEPHILNIEYKMARENKLALSALRESAKNINIQLPEVFIKFMATPSLQERIRSNTECYLYLCPTPIPSPKGGGYLLRFLSDSQACLFWYLYITEDGGDHAVVSSPGFYGIKSEQWRGDEPDEEDIIFCADSFEAFLCRFWLENEIWFAAYEKRMIPEFGTTYIEQYKQNHA